MLITPLPMPLPTTGAGACSSTDAGPSVLAGAVVRVLLDRHYKLRFVMTTVLEGDRLMLVLNVRVSLHGHCALAVPINSGRERAVASTAARTVALLHPLNYLFRAPPHPPGLGGPHPGGPHLQHQPLRGAPLC